MNRARLRTLEVVNIRKQHAAGYAIGELARAYGRTVRTIGRVVKGESYGHIDGDAIDAAPPLPRNIDWDKVMGRRSRTNPQDEPRVRHAPAPAPTLVYHLGSEEQGPRCGVAVVGRRCEYGTTIQKLRELVNMGVGVCKRCFEIGQQAHRDMFPPGPMGGF